MYKVTFPHMGNFYIPCKALLYELDLEPVIPPPISQRTISLGTKIAPEFACFPLKANLGNYIEAIEAGAEFIFMAGGIGPCRFGYYGETQREILKDEGYPIKFLVFEAPKTHPRELWMKLKQLIPHHTLTKLVKAFYIFRQKAKALEEFDRLVNKIRPLEQHRGTASRLQNRFYQQIDNAASINQIKLILNEAIAELKAITLKESFSPLKVVLLGEIYTVLEPRVNFHIEKRLGEMGVEVKRTIYLTDWLLEHLWLSIIKPNWYQHLIGLAEPYLRNSVGGHGLETVAGTVEAGVNRFHGVIQLAPFTCMPEIVAMQVLPAVSKDYGIPVLSIIIDEHSAEAGIETRLEAFIDLLLYQHKRATTPSILDVQYAN